MITDFMKSDSIFWFYPPVNKCIIKLSRDFNQPLAEGKFPSFSRSVSK
jgi:hypothetical protein